MTETPMIGRTPAAALSPAARHSAPHRDVEIKPRPSQQLADTVELSQRAMYLDRLRDLPAVRERVVHDVRAAIGSGDYSIDDKLALAIERLIDDLDE